MWDYQDETFHLATAVRGVYACPQNGVMAANELDIKEDIPEKKKE